jgi:hypothetical protein
MNPKHGDPTIAEIPTVQPETVEASPMPPTIAEIETSIRARFEMADRELSRLREQRDFVSASIRRALLEEAVRIYNALQPRTRKPKAAKK